MKIINDFNLNKQADALGIKIWQTPGFLFIAMGFIAAIIMAATYYLSKNYDNPQVLVISECLVAAIILTVGTSVSSSMEQMLSVNKMKSEFVSVASHQLRTPLSAIKWETELFLSKSREGLDENQIKKIENIAKLNEKMIRLVNDLLDVARIDQNRLILKKQNFDFSRITREMMNYVAAANTSRHISFDLDIEKNLPEVLGDAEKIKLVLDNIVSNAFKYTIGGGKIEARLFKKDKEVIFEVKDNGVGIPEEQIDRVFEKFFRSDNATKYQTEGTGLGLYIAKNIVEQLGGRIWFQSIENVGSKFSFSLIAVEKTV